MARDLFAARGGAATVQHRLATLSIRWRGVNRSGKDAFQGRRQHRLADVRPAAAYLGQSGVTAGGGMGALDGDEVGRGGHGEVIRFPTASTLRTNATTTTDHLEPALPDAQGDDPKLGGVSGQRRRLGLRRIRPEFRLHRRAP